MIDSKIAFLFPGQASQSPGMGLDLYKNSRAARDVFDEADEILGKKLSSIIFNGDKDELTRTENAQPAIATVSLAAWKSIESELGRMQLPNYTAGHSLGEYSSLATAGADKATAATPVAAAVLKNLRLEGDLETFNDFFSLIISISSSLLINCLE